MTSRETAPTDLLVAASFLLMVAAAAAFELYGFDLWWHLATGRLIFSGAGIPSADPFSHTAAGTAWIDHEWLFQCVVYALHSLGGPGALVLGRCLLITVSAGLVLRFVRRETRLPAAAAVLLLTPFVLTARGRFLLRPELFTLLFSVLVLSALFRRRSRPPTFRDLWWVPVLFVPWSNLHAGMIVGIVFLGLFTGGRMIELAGRRARGHGPGEPDGRPGLRLALQLTAAAVAAGLINPFFHHVYVVPFQLTSLVETGLFPNMEWDRPALGSFWLYFLVLAASAALVVARRRSLQWTALLPLLFLAFISLRYVRNTGLFGLLAPVLLATLLGRSGPRRFAALRPSLAIGVLVALAASFLLTDAGLGIDESFIPVQAVDFVERARPPGELFNDGNIGGYLTWRLWPEVRIFSDGRNEVFAEVQRRYRRAESDPRLWNEMLEDYGVGYAVVSYRNPPQEIRVDDARVVLPFAAGHFPRHDWALVYWDDTAMVYVRRRADNAGLIADHESGHVYPEIAAFQVAAIRQGRADRQACLRELEEKLAEDPGSARARELLAAVRSLPSS